MRQELFPLLEQQYNVRVVEALLRVGQLTGAMYDEWQAGLEEPYNRHVCLDGPRQITVDRQNLDTLSLLSSDGAAGEGLAAAGLARAGHGVARLAAVGADGNRRASSPAGFAGGHGRGGRRNTTHHSSASNGLTSASRSLYDPAACEPSRMYILPRMATLCPTSLVSSAHSGGFVSPCSSVLRRSACCTGPGGGTKSSVRRCRASWRRCGRIFGFPFAPRGILAARDSRFADCKLLAREAHAEDSSNIPLLTVEELFIACSSDWIDLWQGNAQVLGIVVRRPTVRVTAIGGW